MTNIWQAKGNKQCPLCKKGVAQIYGENKDGKFVEGCWNCLYK